MDRGNWKWNIQVARIRVYNMIASNNCYLHYEDDNIRGRWQCQEKMTEVNNPGEGQWNGWWKKCLKRSFEYLEIFVFYLPGISHRCWAQSLASGLPSEQTLYCTETQSWILRVWKQIYMWFLCMLPWIYSLPTGLYNIWGGLPPSSICFIFLKDQN